VMIDLRSSNLPISEALREHIERKLDFAIRRFAGRVTRVVVRLVDVNGPRGGPDKRCRIIAHLSPTGSISVEATDGDAYAAASQAAARLDEQVARALERRRPRHVRTLRRGARLRSERFSASSVQDEVA
jgi:putative sigma-54 modulation protein